MYQFFAKSLKTLMTKASITGYRIGEDTAVRAENLHKLVRGVRRPTDDVLKELAGYAPLGVSFEELEAWRLLDEYSPEAIEKAYALLKEKA